MQLSIIVPVYNMAAEGKLNTCMDSLINQTITDYEIIAVDDASTDSSLDILRSYQERYPEKVKVITYPINRRQGGAKNEGLKASSGEWVGFIDSDDWVTPDYYEKLLGKAAETGADMVGCDYCLVSERGLTVEDAISKGKVVQNNSLEQTGKLDTGKHKKLFMRPGSMVIKIYKASIIRENGLGFPEGIFYEDNCAGSVWSLYFNHFEKVEEPMYFYYQHDLSTVHHITEEKCRDRMRAAELLYQECEKRGFLDSYHEELEYRFAELYYVITLFSYMQGVVSPKLSFVKELRAGVVAHFPEFERNTYYRENTGKEEQQLIAMQGKSDLRFYLYYRLKLARRRCISQRNSSFRILFVIEVILLAAGIVGLFGKNAVYEYGPEAMRNNFGVYSEEYGGIMADGTTGMQGNLVDFVGLALPMGTYRVQLHYVTDTDGKNLCEVTDSGIGMGNLRANAAQFFSGRSSTDFEMWLLRNSKETIVHAYYDGTGMLAVQGLTIVQTNAWNRILLFCMLCLFTAVNCVYCYVQYDREHKIPAKNKTVTFCLGLVILFTSIPLTIDYTMSSGDLGYHLMRVEGIRDGILNGQFPIRISPEWQQGYGYASPIFYGETLLYPAAMLRLIGFSMLTSFRLYMFGITVATVLIAYFCFRKICGDAYIGVFCSMMYTLSVYRVYKTYCTGSWGEVLGIMILPLVLYGFYRVFTQDVEEESYKRSWVPLTVGFTLLVQSHLLTGEMTGLFTIILCLILWKKVFRWKTFLVLVKVVVYSVLLSAWFLVPFADYMVTGNFVIQNVSSRTIQYRGLLPVHLFFTHFVNGGTVFFDQYGMYDSAATGLGPAPVLALGILVYLLWTKKLGKASGTGKIIVIVSVLAMLMSLSLFPWDEIQSWNGITATLVSSVQFPNRFLTIANVCLTAGAGLAAKYVMDKKSRIAAVCYFGGMVFLVAVSGEYLMEDALNTGVMVRAYGSEGMGTGYIAGGEYLPYGADPFRFMYHDPICTGALEATDYEKLSLGARAYLTNQGASTESATFSLLYYKGYRCFVKETGEELPVFAGENFQVTADIPAGFEGTVEVRFVSPWYWRVAEGITVVTLSGMIFVYWYRRRALGKASLEAHAEG